MKSITVTLEDLDGGILRATGRHSGRTVAYKDGTDPRLLVAEVMRITCGAHRVGDGYDLTYISLNAAAEAALEP